MFDQKVQRKILSLEHLASLMNSIRIQVESFLGKINFYCVPCLFPKATPLGLHDVSQD